MTLQEHDDRIREEALKEGRQEGHRDGLQEGLQKGMIKILAKLCRDGTLAADEAAREAEMTPDEFQRAVTELAE